jgi:hypothetical protein
MDIMASDVDKEVTCLACANRMGRMYDEARAKEQSK